MNQFLIHSRSMKKLLKFREGEEKYDHKYNLQNFSFNCIANRVRSINIGHGSRCTIFYLLDYRDADWNIIGIPNAIWNNKN